MKRLLMSAAAAALATHAPADAPNVTDTADDDVGAIRDATFAGDSFNAALARDYRAFAVNEADVMVDWIDAEHFAQRAQMSAQGSPPAPEDPDDWLIESDQRMAELETARAALVEVLNGGAREAAPAQAAFAQVSYDCWVEQQEEAWQTPHIVACRNQFLAAAADLRAALMADYPDLAGRLFFEFDESDLTPAASAKLAEIAEALAAEDPRAVTVVGHADTVGTDAYNRGLSMRRAKTVANKLRALGVPEVDVAEPIEVIARGESAPLVETGEGVRLVYNRRVALFEGEPPVGVAVRQ